MNTANLKNELINEVASIQDDVCFVMVKSQPQRFSRKEDFRIYDNLSNVWHTMREIRIDLCLEMEKETFRNPDIIGRDMTKEDFLDKIENIIKKIKNLVIKLRDLSNAEPKFFDLGYTPQNIVQAYQANNARLLLEDLKRIINEE